MPGSVTTKLPRSGKYLEELAKTESTIAKVPTKSLPSEIGDASVFRRFFLVNKVLGKMSVCCNQMMLRNGGSG